MSLHASILRIGVFFDGRIMQRDDLKINMQINLYQNDISLISHLLLTQFSTIQPNKSHIIGTSYQHPQSPSPNKNTIP